MLLLLVRHALAAERDDTRFPDDNLRPLVPKGRKVQRRISRRLAKLGLAPDVIFSSPWKRAWQTAGTLAAETGVGKKRRVPCDALAKGPNLEELAAAMGSLTPDAVVALVGHDPWISELASLLLTGSATRLGIQFAKSGIMGIEAEAIAPASGRIRFFITPE